MGFSRDDAGKFLPDYLKKGIYEHDPFRSIDQKGVGLLVAMAVEKGRAVRPGIEVGVCGEPGGDPASVAFFHHAVGAITNGMCREATVMVLAVSSTPFFNALHTTLARDA